MKRTRSETISTIEESILKKIKFKKQYKEFVEMPSKRGWVRDVDAKNEKDKVKYIDELELPTVNRLLKKFEKFIKEATERNDVLNKDVILDKMDELYARRKVLEKVTK